MKVTKHLKAIRKFGYTKYYYFLIGFFTINILLVIVTSGRLSKQLKIFTNTSDSMLPVIDNGSLTLVREQPRYSYKVGDIVTFYQKDKEKEITHRIYRLAGNVYITKGDNNEAIDLDPVEPRLVIGKVVMIIPFLGYWAAFIKTKPGIAFFILTPAVVIVLSEASNIILSLKKRKKT